MNTHEELIEEAKRLLNRQSDVAPYTMIRRLVAALDESVAEQARLLSEWSRAEGELTARSVRQGVAP